MRLTAASGVAVALDFVVLVVMDGVMRLVRKRAG